MHVEASSEVVASCAMASQHLERCAELRQWRLSHAGELPRRKSDNQEEASLAMWLSKALPRRSRSLGDGPSKKQLTPEETAHLNSILQEKFHASADNAATDIGSQQPLRLKPSLTSGDLRHAGRSSKRQRKDEVLLKDSDMRDHRVELPIKATRINTDGNPRAQRPIQGPEWNN